MKNHPQSNAAIISELRSLSGLDRGELEERWRILYGKEPPGRVKNRFLIIGIAYHMQENALGGLKLVTRRFLEKAAQNNGFKNQISSHVNINLGTRLLREWHGTTYEVIILEDSIYCNGKRYRSLSEIARSITGTRRS
ncbi:MAG TPA: DUF2924 domain-containing protein, partial [Paludibacter sp.]|nr:DUF2924 domain-containing protein [Paludibacter sp.]